MSVSLNTIPLPDDLKWSDEFSPRVMQLLKTSLDGTPHIIAMSRSKGLPITLSSWTDGAFVIRSTVLELQALADLPGVSMPLILRDTSFLVMFRHHDGQAFTADPVKDIANPASDDLYRITLNLITI
jgi:hypothetical protein